MEILRVLKKITLMILSWFMMLKLLPLRFVELFGQLFPEDAAGCKIRGWLYRPFLFKCGRNFQVALRVKLENPSKLEIGDNVYIGHGSWINGFRDGVVLESEVMLGPYVTIVANNHTKIDYSYRFGKGSGGKIVIKSGSWLGAKATITAGVTVGEGVLVGANSVVTKNIPNYSKIGGVPAKEIIKKTNEQ